MQNSQCLFDIVKAKPRFIEIWEAVTKITPDHVIIYWYILVILSLGCLWTSWTKFTHKEFEISQNSYRSSRQSCPSSCLRLKSLIRIPRKAFTDAGGNEDPVGWPEYYLPATFIQTQANGVTQYRNAALMYLSWVSDYRLMRWCDTPTPPSLTILQDRRRGGQIYHWKFLHFCFTFDFMKYHFIVVLHLINSSYKLHTKLVTVSPFQVCTSWNTLIVTKCFTQYHWIRCSVDT